MESIDKVFLAALANHLHKRGSQRQLALKVGIEPAYLNQILKGKRFGTDETRRKIAAALGYPGPRYEEFLNIGRAILEGKEPPKPEPRYIGPEDLKERNLIAVPFTENMKLAAGGGGTIPYDEDEDSSPVVVHAKDLGRRNNHLLQAFRVGGDSMEPAIAEGGIVVVDKAENRLDQISEGKIYALCWDLYDGECAIKRLRWAEKGRTLALESINPAFSSRFMSPSEVKLIGRVIWSWRVH